MTDTTDLTRLTMPALMAWHAERTPERTFLQDAISGRSWSYGEIFDASRRWAGAYQRAGVAAGDTVLTMFTTRIEFFFSWLGLSWLKGVDVPINTEYKGAMLRHVGDNSAARIMLIQGEFLGHLLDIVGDLDSLERIVVLDDVPGGLPAVPAGKTICTIDDFLAGAEPLADLVAPELHDTATIVYTSGTTGPSKGVIQAWNQLRRNAYYSFPIDDITADDAFYFTTPTYHQGGKLVPYAMAMKGGRFIFREKFSAGEFWDEIRKLNVTFTILVGAMGPFIVNQPPSPDDADNPLRWVQVIPVMADVDTFKERFGVQVMTAYGMTEVSCVFATFEVTNENAASCGTPVPGCDVRLVDEFDEEVPVGTVGELIVRCDEPYGHNQGYLRMPEATAAAWRNQWIHTGDGVRCDEHGWYYFVDRLKDAIRRRGENISSTEVEAIVVGHPAIAAVAAIGVPSELSEDELKVCVVLHPDQGLEPAELIEWLVPRMPRFMIPRYIEFVADLPQTANKKTKKAELRADALNDRTWDREAAGIVLPR